VVLAFIGRSGNPTAVGPTLRTIDRWNPRCLLLCGVAGGLRKDGLVEGDVVASTVIWHYEYGKIGQGRHIPRLDKTYHPDQKLLSSAILYGHSSTTWTHCRVAPPKKSFAPKFRKGVAGSGEKVIDNIEAAYFRDICRACSNLLIIEMEGVGASTAVELAKDEGREVSFLMIRGISDLPRSESRAARLWAWIKSLGHSTTPVTQTMQRDNWKPYAARTAADFVAQWLGARWDSIFP
jgi:nucleoside phosphorylase